MNKPVVLGSITFPPQPTRFLVGERDPERFVDLEREKPKPEVSPEEGTVLDLLFLASLRFE